MFVSIEGIEKKNDDDRNLYNEVKDIWRRRRGFGDMSSGNLSAVYV